MSDLPEIDITIYKYNQKNDYLIWCSEPEKISIYVANNKFLVFSDYQAAMEQIEAHFSHYKNIFDKNDIPTIDLDELSLLLSEKTRFLNAELTKNDVLKYWYPLTDLDCNLKNTPFSEWNFCKDLPQNKAARKHYKIMKHFHTRF